jgi:hypothetical protein
MNKPDLIAGLSTEKTQPLRGSAAKTWRRNNDPKSLEALRALMAFLKSCLDSLPDPASMSHPPNSSR